MNLQELEAQYSKLGKEIEKLKNPLQPEFYEGQLVEYTDSDEWSESPSIGRYVCPIDDESLPHRVNHGGHTTNWTHVRPLTTLPWVKHGGGACPVDRDALVLVMLRDGEFDFGPAGTFLWPHDPEDYADVIKYTEVK